jgi:hypothetical protein
VGGSGKGGAPSNPQLEQSQAGLANSLASLAGQQQTESSQLFANAFPGQVQAEQFYSALASGDPGKIAQVIAPATQQISQATAGAKQNILQNAPAGGARDLAIAQTSVNQGAQIGQLASQGYTGSFNALASLGQAGVGQSQGAAGIASSAFGQANSAYSNIVQENIQQKGATLGAFGAAAGDAASVGAAFA